MTVATAIPAATVVVLRDHGSDGLEVFLVRRDQRMKFMAGAFVFPGGRVDPSDRAANAEAWIDGAPAAAARMSDLSAEEAISYYVAAARELFEEAGLLLARGPDGAMVRLGQAAGQGRFAAHRADVHAGRWTLREILLEERLRLAADALVAFAHWVTPDVEPRRFDTRFFLAQVPEHQEPAHDTHETTEGIWIAPQAALDRCWQNEIVLGPPTWSTLSELSRFASVAEALEWGRARTIVRIQPAFRSEDGTDMLLLPGDPLYGAMTSPVTVGATRFVLEGGRWRARNA